MNRAIVEWTFFCITPLGLEDLAITELEHKKTMLGLAEIQVNKLKGGFEITLPWHLGRGMLHTLKIPTRILVRLTEFKARDFAKAFNKLKSLPWNQWITHPETKFEVSAHECRLIQTTRMGEVCKDALKEFLKGSPLSLRYQKENIAPETIYLRGVQDEWTISLDITGEPLYKRGLSLIKDLAPLRENLAAAALFALSLKNNSPTHLWDPMCGSGTFIFEAQQFHLPSQRPFAYEKSTLNLGVAPWKALAEATALPYLSAVGSDLREELMAKLPDGFFAHDFFNPIPKPIQSPLSLVMNPPYGERIKLDVPTSVFQSQILSQIEILAPKSALIVKPAAWKAFRSQKYSSETLFSVSNGGIEVEIVYLKRRV
jgi:putative N6-adenine-specific DNA methylase